MSELFLSLSGSRLWPLIIKELRQIGRNRRLVFSLIIPPTLQLMLFGFALNPDVKNLRLGVVDESRTFESRELTSAFVESQSFDIAGEYLSADELGRALSRGRLDMGLIIPHDYAKMRERHQTANVQILVDAVNSNTAAIASGYASRIINALNQKIARSASSSIQSPPPPSQQQSQANAGNTNANSFADLSANSPPVALSVAAASPLSRAQVLPRITLLYNPGLLNSWFIVTGTLGTLLVLNGSIVASASMVKEKEVGTIEQLLMTPAGETEIIIAKMAPLFILLVGDVGLAVSVGRLVFGVPVRGSLLLLICAGALCVLVGIGIGTFLATFTRSQQQAQLMGFFVNPPLAMLAGATTPIEGMPAWLQPVTYLNPVRHFATISRGVMLKGVGIEELYPNLLALLGMAVLLVGISVWRFRKQLG